MTRGTLVVASILVPAWLTAQTGPITIRLSPIPNQTIRTHTSQETAMTSEQESPAPGPAIAPQNIHTIATMDTTATVGPADAQGHYEAHVVCDAIASTTTMNDKPMTIPTPEPRPLTFTMFYDDRGKTIDMTGEGTAANQAVSALKQMMSNAMTTPATLTLAVGESVTVPVQLTMPHSTGGSSASGGAMTTTGETAYTLTAVTFDGADRIAHLTTKKTATLSGSPADTETVGFTLEQRFTGDGTLDVNIDRGITLHSSERITIDGTTRIAHSGSAERLMRMHGTIAINSDVAK